MINILHIVGTRPQYIKLFPLWVAMKDSETFKQNIYDTGQHYDQHMSKELIDEFGFYGISYGNLEGLGPDEQIPLMISNIWSELVKHKPDYVFIYGDTNSTLAAAIACAKNGIPYGHVEAGVRTDPKVGIQEGVNRKVADHLATHHYCSTQEDYDNLLSEGSNKSKSYLVGDLMADAFRLISSTSTNKKNEENNSRPTILVTIHRAENVDDVNIRNKIIKTLVTLSKNYHIILPIHPRLKSRLSNAEMHSLETSGIEQIPPLKYSDIVQLLHCVDGVVTDSGGLPKDAAYAGIRSIVLRSDPIWNELANIGYIKTTDDIEKINAENLANHITNSLSDTPLKPYYTEPATPKIMDIVINHYRKFS